MLGTIAIMLLICAGSGWLKYYLIFKPMFEDLHRNMSKDITSMRKRGSPALTPPHKETIRLRV